MTALSLPPDGQGLSVPCTKSACEESGLGLSFVAALRRLLPDLRTDAERHLTHTTDVSAAFRCRARIVGVPDQSLDGVVLLPPESRARQLSHEALFSYLLIAVFCASLRQGLNTACARDDVLACIPELAAYSWYLPSDEMARAIEKTLHRCRLWPIPMNLASTVYQGSLTRQEKKQLGQYYTPPALVEHLLDLAAYAPGKGLDGLILLDVAIGFGAFLAEAARRLIRDLVASRHTLDEIVMALGYALRGYDLQPFAVIATKLHILAVLIDEMRLSGTDVRKALSTLRLPHVRAQDTLAVPDAQTTDAPHLVVGNPPYGPCAHGPHLAPFADVIGGRANLYQLFMYKALRLCRDGGTVALLVPESMRAGPFFLKLRRYLAEQADLIGLTDFHARTSLFDGVEQGVLIIALRKRGIGPTDDTNRVRVAQVPTAAALASTVGMTIPTPHVQAGENMAHALVKASSPDAYALLHKLRTAAFEHKRLSIAIHTGPVVWNRVAEDLGPSYGPGLSPVIYAQSVHQYAFGFPPRAGRLPCADRLYLRPTAAMERFGLSFPTILLQRTTSREQRQRLIATIVPPDFLHTYPTYYVENHVNYVAQATCEGKPVPLTFVLGLLNSRLMNFVFAAINGSTQVSAYELGLLPLLYHPDTGIERLVATRLSGVVTDTVALERHINRRMYDLYGLTARERRLVDRYHAHYHTSTGRLIVRGA